ncbi:MAG TPA: NAD(+)/NADH kinase [Acidimicrobiia bacterium]|jgi:NAD+ kinase|nr:NAD(+)/NADH kinase [Acidimicrobiia bacterium]
MRIALVIHPYRSEAAEIAARLVAEASARGFSVSASEEDAARVPGTEVRGPGPGHADVVVAVGGDGTVLEGVRLGIEADLPVLGVNAGHMGFLAEVEPAMIPEALAALAAGDYTESRRMTLAARFSDGDQVIGVNDTVIEKAVSQHILRVEVWVNQERLIGYRTDAVVVATPTGSTAYTFSAGGPLVDPELEALIVTPVAPHTLFGRPLVFQPEVKLTFRVEGDRPGRVNVDGRSHAVLQPGNEVVIARGEPSARFIRLVPRNFATAVREKFHLHDA